VSFPTHQGGDRARASQVYGVRVPDASAFPWAPLTPPRRRRAPSAEVAEPPDPNESPVPLAPTTTDTSERGSETTIDGDAELSLPGRWLVALWFRLSIRRHR
jgi:hypothetical protein